MKKFFSLLLSLVLFAILLPLQAEADDTVKATSNNGAEWNVTNLDESNHTCTVAAPFTWNSGAQSSNASSGAFLEIPTSLRYNDTDYTVTGIRGYILNGQNIQTDFSSDTIIIPNTITSIDRNFLSGIDNESFAITKSQ